MNKMLEIRRASGLPPIANEVVMDGERGEINNEIPRVEPEETVSSGSQASPSSRSHLEEAAGGDGNRPGRRTANGKVHPHDRRWRRNFRRLKRIIRPDGSLDYSSLSIDDERRMKNFARQQRRYFRMREKNEATPLTDERYGLLAGTDFSFVSVRGAGRKGSRGPEKGVVGPEAAARRKAGEVASGDEADDPDSSDDESDTDGGGPDGDRKMNGLDRMWHEKFDRLRPIIRPDGSLDYPSLDEEARMPMKRFVYGQRKAFQQREDGEKSSLTDERRRLLADAGFSFAPVDGTWRDKFDRLRSIVRPDGSPDYSSLGGRDRKLMQRFVGGLRKGFSRRENGGKSSLTDERVRLLVEAGFSFVEVKASSSGREPDESNPTNAEAVAELGGKPSAPKEARRTKKRKASEPTLNAVKSEEGAGDAPDSAPGSGPRRVEHESQALRGDGKVPNDDGGDEKMGAYDRKWHENFVTLKSIIGPDGSPDYSSLDAEGQRRMRNFAKEQRRCFRRRTKNERSAMTDERHGLLAGANFRFDARGTTPRTAGTESGPGERMSAILEGADERYPLFDEGAGREERAPSGPGPGDGGVVSESGTRRKRRKSCEAGPDDGGPAEEADGAPEGADGGRPPNDETQKCTSCKPGLDDGSSAEEAGGASGSTPGTECAGRKPGEPKRTPANEAGEGSENLPGDETGPPSADNGTDPFLDEETSSGFASASGRSMTSTSAKDDRCCLM